MEESLVKSRGLGYYGITSGKLRRYASLKNVIDILRVGVGFLQALSLLKKLKPSLVFSKGGYVTVPVIAAAGLLKIPCFTHESDMDPGLATRINAKFALKIFVSAEETIKYFSPDYRSKCLVTGNPVRPEILEGDADNARRILGFPPKENADAKPLLLILGGSQGAMQINNLVHECHDRLLTRWQVIHQTGPYESRKIAHKDYRSFTFIGPEIGDFLAAADLVISRAGANTLWELSALSKPAILIPLDLTGSRGDQLRNAKVFEERGAAIVLTGEKANAALLLGSLEKVFDTDGVLPRMAQASGGICRRDAAMVIAEILKNFEVSYDSEHV